MNLERITNLILKQSPLTDPETIKAEFDRTKEAACPKCVFNINLPMDHVCGDCPHIPLADLKDTYLKEKISTEKERETRLKLIGAPPENFVCDMCNKEYHRKDAYELAKRDICIDCFSRYVKNAARFINEAGLMQAIRFFESKTLSTCRYVNKDDYKEDTALAIQNEMHDEIWEKVKKHARTGFYAHIQRGHLEDYNQIHLKCQYTFLSQHDVNLLIKIFYERDINTDKILEKEMLEGFFRKENDKIVPTEKCDEVDLGGIVSDFPRAYEAYQRWEHYPAKDHRQLFDFFDNERIHVALNIEVNEIDSFYYGSVVHGKDTHAALKGYNSREAAEMHGFETAFRVLEKKLNEVKE